MTKPMKKVWSKDYPGSYTAKICLDNMSISLTKGSQVSQQYSVASAPSWSSYSCSFSSQTSSIWCGPSLNGTFHSKLYLPRKRLCRSCIRSKMTNTAIFPSASSSNPRQRLLRNPKHSMLMPIRFRDMWICLLFLKLIKIWHTHHLTQVWIKIFQNGSRTRITWLQMNTALRNSN